MSEQGQFAFAIADILMWDETAERRDRIGAQWCEFEGFGCWRLMLERPIILTNDPQMEAALAEARDRARIALPIICRACGRCPWATK